MVYQRCAVRFCRAALASMDIPFPLLADHPPTDRRRMVCRGRAIIQNTHARQFDSASPYPVQESFGPEIHHRQRVLLVALQGGRYRAISSTLVGAIP